MTRQDFYPYLNSNHSQRRAGSMVLPFNSGQSCHHCSHESCSNFWRQWNNGDIPIERQNMINTETSTARVQRCVLLYNLFIINIDWLIDWLITMLDASENSWRRRRSFYPSVLLSVCPSVLWSFRLLIRPSFCLSVLLSVCPFVLWFVRLSFDSSILWFVYPLVRPSFGPYVLQLW